MEYHFAKWKPCKIPLTKGWSSLGWPAERPRFTRVHNENNDRRPDLQRRATLRLGDSRSVGWAEWSNCCKIELMRPKWYRATYGTSVTELVCYFCWRGTGFVMNRIYPGLPISWANDGGKRRWYGGGWQATKRDKFRQDRLVIQKIKFTRTFSYLKFKTFVGIKRTFLDTELSG